MVIVDASHEPPIPPQLSAIGRDPPKREWVHSWKPTEYSEPPFVRRPRTYTCSKCALVLTEPELRREGNTCPRFV